MDVDTYGLPIRAFGSELPPHFFALLGRILAVNSQIEFLQDRLEHLPAEETLGVRKVDQFMSRCASSRESRNAIVHSRWVCGADLADPAKILGIRYKKRKRTGAGSLTVSILDVENSEREQETVEHTIESLRALLKHDITTMQIGHYAYTEVMLPWAAARLEADGGGERP